MASQEQTYAVEGKKIMSDQVVKNTVSDNRFQNLANDSSQYELDNNCLDYYGHHFVNRSHMIPLSAPRKDSSIHRPGIKNRQGNTY